MKEGKKMSVCDFTKIDKHGLMYRLVDATKQPCMTKPVILEEAGRSVIVERFGDREVVGYGIASKTTMILYVK